MRKRECRPLNAKLRPATLSRRTPTTFSLVTTRDTTPIVAPYLSSPSLAPFVQKPLSTPLHIPTPTFCTSLCFCFSLSQQPNSRESATLFFESRKSERECAHEVERDVCVHTGTCACLPFVYEKERARETVTRRHVRVTCGFLRRLQPLVPSGVPIISPSLAVNQPPRLPLRARHD